MFIENIDGLVSSSRGAQRPSCKTKHCAPPELRSCLESWFYKHWVPPGLRTQGQPKDHQTYCYNFGTAKLRIENLFLLEERPLPRYAFLIRAFALHHIAFDVALQD